LIELPDGELEDEGTTFTVSAEESGTTRVAVEEGSVELRLRGREPVTIRAGGTWTREERAPVSASSAVALAPPSSSSVAQTPLAVEHAPTAAEELRAAMALFDAGDHRRAAAAFASYVTKHPSDPRAEDAAYLRVIALQRSGDDAATKEAARDYIARFPAGFRRAEVERLE
jgi:TolA-binding protein